MNKFEADRRRGVGNRRRDLRQPFVVAVRQTTEARGVELALATNLGHGGIELRQACPHAVGTRVTLRFQLPEREEIVDVEGEIVFCAPPYELGAHHERTGVRFLPGPAVARIADYFG